MDDKRVSGSPARDPLTKNKITRQNNFITSVGNLSNARCSGLSSDNTGHLPSKILTKRDYSPGFPGNHSRFALSETRDTLNYETTDQPPSSVLPAFAGSISSFSEDGGPAAADALFPLSYSRVMMFMECPFRFFLRYLYGLPEAHGRGRKHNGLILRAIFNRYCGNNPTPLLFGDNLSRDMEQIEFGLQYLQSKEIVGLDVPFSLDRFSNPVPFDEPEAVFRGVGQVLSREEKNRPESEDLRREVRGQRFEERKDLDLHTSNLTPLTSVPPHTSSQSVDVSYVLSHFKTGFGNPDWERLLVYAWALSRHGYDICRVEWVSLSAGCAASRDVTREDLNQAGSNVIAWIRQIMESEFEPEAGDHCSYCLYHSLCPLMEKLDQQMQISDQVSLRETLNKSIALQEGAKKMKGLADEYLDREGIGEVKLGGYDYGKDEVSPMIRITSKEDALDTVLGLGDPFRFLSFKNLAELVSYLPEESYEIKERLKPDRRFRKA